MTSNEIVRNRTRRGGNQPSPWLYTAFMAAVSGLIASVFSLGAYVNASENVPMAAFLSFVTLAFVTIPPFALHRSLRTTYVRRRQPQTAPEPSAALKGPTANGTESESTNGRPVTMFDDIWEMWYEEHVVNLAPRIIWCQLDIEETRVLAWRRDFDELKEIVKCADEHSRIAWDDGTQLMCADLVVSGTDQSEDAIYVLAEISRTIQQQHVNLARARARILEQAIGVRTIPAVIGAAPVEGATPEDVRVIIIPTKEELDAHFRT